jgi:cellulose synthase/poly-beta-1,6-N-acetylglucosamine synthase-like glycosyltransferase
MISIQILLIVISCTYVAIIALLTFGWFKLEKYRPSKKDPKVQLSIIIPARNEENNIVNCLNDIIEQDYPDKLYEIIVVDDDSDDNTCRIVESVINAFIDQKVQVYLIKNNGTGKKEAIRTGIKKAEGDIIITTDADCRMNRKWVRTIADYFCTSNIKLLAGPVTFHNSKSLFKSMQTLEFLGLVASAAGSIKCRIPILGNASNLAFTKEAYLRADKYRKDYGVSSGDDTFLINQIKKIYGSDKIAFLKNYDSIVRTDSMKTLKELVSQRIRWISKSKKHNDPFASIVALITYLFNLSLFISFIIGLFNHSCFALFLILYLSKIITDLPIIYGITSFTRQLSLLWLYIPLQLINIPYVTVIAIAGYFGKTKWKGRRCY